MLYLTTIVVLALAMATCSKLLEAQCTSDCSPVAPAQETEQLRPLRILFDTSSYTFHFEPGCAQPFGFELDLQPPYIYVATGSTVERWHTGTWQRAGRCQPVLGLWKKTDHDFYVTSLDCAHPRYCAIGLEGGMGVVVLDRHSFALLYQLDGLTMRSVAIEGDVLVAAEEGPRLHRFDLGAIGDLPCLEGAEHPTICPGVYQGVVPGPRPFWLVSGSGGQFSTREYTDDGRTYRASDMLLLQTETPRPAWVSRSEEHLARIDYAGLIRLDGQAMAIARDHNRIHLSELLAVGSTSSVLGQRERFLEPETGAVVLDDPPEATYWEHYARFRSYRPYQVIAHEGRLYRSAWGWVDVHAYSLPDPNLIFRDGLESGDTSAWSGEMP